MLNDDHSYRGSQQMGPTAFSPGLVSAVVQWYYLVFLAAVFAIISCTTASSSTRWLSSAACTLIADVVSFLAVLEL